MTNVEGTLKMTEMDSLAASLSDYAFEMLLRARARKALEVIETLATDGPSSYNSLTFKFDKSGGKWVVTTGKNYEGVTVSSGEVLDSLVKVAVDHVAGLAKTKLTLLAPGPSAGPSAPDDEITF
jgi:hypothetical protein